MDILKSNNPLMTYQGFQTYLINYCTGAFGSKAPNNEELRQLSEAVLQEMAAKYITIEMVGTLLQDIRDNMVDHVVTQRQTDRTGGMLTLKYIEGVYKLIIENKITGFYEQLFETTKTSLAHHSFYTVFMATADAEFKKDIAECDFNNVLHYELSRGLHV